MGCKSAKYDSEDGRYVCEVSGDGCMYMFPDSKRCAEEWGEGPDAYPDHKCGNCQGFKMVDGKRACFSTWGRCAWEVEVEVVADGLVGILIDEDTEYCGAFRKLEQQSIKNDFPIVLPGGGMIGYTPSFIVGFGSSHATTYMTMGTIIHDLMEKMKDSKFGDSAFVIDSIPLTPLPEARYNLLVMDKYPNIDEDVMWSKETLRKIVLEYINRGDKKCQK